MSTLFDRLNQELEAFGKRAQSALDEGKSQIELVRVKRQRDVVARDLGLLVYRRERSGAAEPARIDALMLRLDDLEGQITRFEQEAAAARGAGAAAAEADPSPSSPAEPATAQSGPAE